MSKVIDLHSAKQKQQLQQELASFYEGIMRCLRDHQVIPDDEKIMTLVLLAIEIANHNQPLGKGLPVESVIVGADAHARIIMDCFTETEGKADA